MNWKTKALIQRACASLPAGSEAAYYFLQKNLGSLRFAPDPMPNLRDLAGIAADLSQSAGFSIEGKRVMEVGTGRRLDMPVGFYLLGAKSVETYDLHPYMKDELVVQSVAGMLKNRDELVELYGAIAGKATVGERLNKLAAARSAREIMDAASIRYHAPADATKTGLPDASIDLQFSFTVFEHIPAPVLAAILNECSRILAPGGLACHHIDPSDHFAHDDNSISFVNFLQFEEPDWSKYNDNQFAYHNRLRVDAFEKIYRDVNHEAILWRTWRNERAVKELSDGTLKVASQYRGVSVETLGTTAIRAISRPKRG